MFFLSFLIFFMFVSMFVRSGGNLEELEGVEGEGGGEGVGEVEDEKKEIPYKLKYALTNVDSNDDFNPNRYILDFTPNGNVIMKYSPDRSSFEYYCDKSIPFDHLETVARKYVNTFQCPSLYVKHLILPSVKRNIVLKNRFTRLGNFNSCCLLQKDQKHQQQGNKYSYKNFKKHQL